jgi:hypothetical protein
LDFQGAEECVIGDKQPKQLEFVFQESGDLKAGVGGVKPQLSHLPLGALTYAARAFQYGSGKYARGNYRRPTVDKLADFDRLAAYIDASLRHLFAVTTEMEWRRGNTELTGLHLMTGGYPDAESGLPHLCHALCSLIMAIQQGIDSGILPEDPGTPWEKSSAK